MIITEKKSKLVSYIIYVISALILIIDHKTVLAGVSQGLYMCARYIIPSLFMMCIVSSVLISSPYSENLFTSALSGLFGFEKNLGVCVFFGLIAGFPSGAIGAFALYENRTICQRDCERAVYFTNNAGLAFIIGTVGTLMGSIKYAVILWLSQTLASLTLSNVFKTKNARAMPPKTPAQAQIGLVEAVKKGAATMLTVCAFVCFFTSVRLLVEDALKSCIDSKLMLSFTVSFLEIGNAVFSASDLPKYSEILCSFSVGFGGLSAILQSVAVCPCVKISRYFAARIMMGFLCVGYTYIISLII